MAYMATHQIRHWHSVYLQPAIILALNRHATLSPANLQVRWPLRERLIIQLAANCKYYSSLPISYIVVSHSILIFGHLSLSQSFFILVSKPAVSLQFTSLFSLSPCRSICLHPIIILALNRENHGILKSHWSLPFVDVHRKLMYIKFVMRPIQSASRTAPSDGLDRLRYSNRYYAGTYCTVVQS